MNYFFDTSALKYRYVEDPKARGIRRIISTARNTCYIAELTILEMSRVWGSFFRDRRLTLAEVKRCEAGFWSDIASGRLVVRATTRREIERARHLMQYAGIDQGKNITSVDALIAATCLECALSTRSRVSFCLEDKRLHGIVRTVPAYRSVLRFHYIGPK